MSHFHVPAQYQLQCVHTSIQQLNQRLQWTPSTPCLCCGQWNKKKGYWLQRNWDGEHRGPPHLLSSIDWILLTLENEKLALHRILNGAPQTNKRIQILPHVFFSLFNLQETWRERVVMVKLPCQYQIKYWKEYCVGTFVQNATQHLQNIYRYVYASWWLLKITSRPYFVSGLYSLTEQYILNVKWNYKYI